MSDTEIFWHSWNQWNKTAMMMVSATVVDCTIESCGLYGFFVHHVEVTVTLVGTFQLRQCWRYSNGKYVEDRIRDLDVSPL